MAQLTKQAIRAALSHVDRNNFVIDTIKKGSAYKVTFYKFRSNYVHVLCLRYVVKSESISSLTFSVSV